MSCLVNQSEIHKLVESEEASDRRRAAASLGSAFCQISDKDQACQDLHRLIRDADISVRREAAEALGSAFAYVPDKKLIWEDLHVVSSDVDEEVRSGAASALGSAFPLVPNKQAAWEDLLRLTQDSDISVRREAANVIGSVFEYIPEKKQALNYLFRLTKDEHSKVRVYAYNSLGRISILKATVAEDEECMRNEIKNALDYFDKSLKEERQRNPAEFCYPFYRSFLAIALQDSKEEEILKYLEDAKKAVGGSEKRADLLEALENLAKALLESRKLNSLSLKETAGELLSYRRYCEEAAKIIDATEESAPTAVRLIRKGNPILKERIQTTIGEIKINAGRICKSFNGSDSEYEAPSKELYRAARGLSYKDILSVDRCSSRIVVLLEYLCKTLPEFEKKLVCEIIKEIEFEEEVPEKLNKIELALTYMAPLLEKQMSHNEQFMNVMNAKLTKGIEKTIDKVKIQETSEEQFKYDVIFIYNHTDVEEVMKIGEILEQQGIKIWIDVREMRPGESIYKVNDMLSKIKTSAVFVGKDGIGPWQDITIRTLLGNFAKNKKLIIPILLNSAIADPELPIFMKNLVWIDFRKDDPDPLKQLVWGIKGEKV